VIPAEYTYAFDRDRGTLPRPGGATKRASRLEAELRARPQFLKLDQVIKIPSGKAAEEKAEVGGLQPLKQQE
jgi:hypothetical protein